MKKEKRQIVHQKYDGNCAYCGNPVEYKDFQVDHIIPKERFYVQEHKNRFKVNDFENLNPSCRGCNHYKTVYTVEEFRVVMCKLHEKIEKQSLDKIAIKYGMLQIKPFDGVFYFEKKGGR